MRTHVQVHVFLGMLRREVKELKTDISNKVQILEDTKKLLRIADARREELEHRMHKAEKEVERRGRDVEVYNIITVLDIIFWISIFIH